MKKLIAVIVLLMMATSCYALDIYIVQYGQAEYTACGMEACMSQPTYKICDTKDCAIDSIKEGQTTIYKVSCYPWMSLLSCDWKTVNMTITTKRDIKEEIKK